MSATPEMAAVVWLLMLAGIGAALWRLRARRRHIGSAGAVMAWFDRVLPAIELWYPPPS